MNNNIDPNSMYGLNKSNISGHTYTPHNYSQSIIPSAIATNPETINNISAEHTLNQLRNLEQINSNNSNTIKRNISHNNMNNSTEKAEQFPVNHIMQNNLPSTANNTMQTTEQSQVSSNMPDTEQILDENTMLEDYPSAMYQYPPSPSDMPYNKKYCKSCGISEPIEFHLDNENNATLSDYTENPIVDNMPTPILNQKGQIQEFVEPEDVMNTQLTGSHAGLTQTPATIAQNADIAEDVTPKVTGYHQPTVVNTESLQYMNGYLRTQKGKMAEVEFLVGNSNTCIKRGYLIGIGTNYIILKEFGSNKKIICDYYNIKFVSIYENSENEYM